ncbi:outer membrane beta-barrel protein [Photobacterium sp. CCB-ST2H9]|uniref:outer membrane beta-barrel protein n=1 Tax=Photobacterium sp. CCB-ST2H9 TaxID=2912855 RepID=UPI0020040A3C|nr:outer membrane beta-barrel protein [Photobacterium sp. CCB-ST2H9]UTM56050.1 outer membrane beta-barrel protein [Photobacterium sp. CCB-ST2H9]
MKKIIPFAVFAVCVSSFSAQAETYIGASLGQTKINSVDISGNILGMSGSQSYDADESMVSGSLFAGYNFNSYIGVEVTVGGIDALEEETLTVDRMTYFAVQPKLSLPLTKQFAVFAKAGLAHFSADFTASNSVYGYSGYTTVSTSDTTLMFGLGAEYAFNEHLKVSANWDYLKPELEVLNVAGASLSVEPEFQQLSLGLSYHF